MTETHWLYEDGVLLDRPRCIECLCRMTFHIPTQTFFCKHGHKQEASQNEDSHAWYNPHKNTLS